MKIILAFFITVLFVTGLINRVSGQISPGELAAAHADLEGITNCTKCHILGEKLTNAKCLDCHTEIKQLTANKKGYHASQEVQGVECFSCHSEHHGRSFKIINFDKDKFNHTKAGFELSGKHKEIECNSCHKSEFIRKKISQRKGFTYLGLETECKACHEDYHQGTLSAQCMSCHNFNAFKPATEFDHKKTKFPLVGGHQKVACEKCHSVEMQKGTKFQKFAGIQFANCTNCHKDPHENKFGQNCRKCHNENSFHIIIALSAFDHSKTNYPLTGKHLAVNCIACHKGNYIQPIKHNLCSDCHTDYHKGQFAKGGVSPDCSGCHSTDGFTTTLYSVERHNMTKFKLEGKHVSVQCSSCHKKEDTWQFTNLGTRCIDCHTDYHKGQFSKAGKTPDCNVCHDTRAFAITDYSIANHNKTEFPLEGAHEATPCSSCHLREKIWQFRNIGKYCVDCHLNIHKNYIDAKYFPGEDCRRCHTMSSWNGVNFDHSQTNFPLKDRHAEISCKQCHLFERKGETISQKFAGLSNNCLTCHKDVHNQQFEVDGITRCDRCHAFKNWSASQFNHDNTRFKLGNNHSNVKCDKCHDQIKGLNGLYTRYKINKLKCSDCHS